MRARPGILAGARSHPPASGRDRPSPTRGRSLDEAGAAPRAADGLAARAAGRLRCRPRTSSARPHPAAGEPVDVAPDDVPDHRCQRHRDRPARPQRPRRPEHLLDRRLPGVLRRGLHAAGERLLLGRLHRHRRRAPTPRPASGARDSPTQPDEVAGNAYYDTSLRPDRLRPGAARGALHRLRPVPRARWSWPTSSATPCRAASASPPTAAASRTRRRPTASPAPGPAGSPTGKAEHVSLRTPELDDVIRGFLLLRDDVGSDPERQPGARLLLRPRLGVLRGLRRRCRPRAGTTSATDRLFTAAAFERRGRRQTGATPRTSEIVELGRHDAAGVLDRRRSRPPSASDFTPPTVESFDGHGARLRGRRTATWATAPTRHDGLLDETDLADAGLPTRSATSR